MAKKQYQFFNWIEEKGGPMVLAKRLGISHNCVYAWLYNVTTPKALTMKRIVKLSKGKISYEDMIESTTQKRTKVSRSITV